MGSVRQIKDAAHWAGYDILLGVSFTSSCFGLKETAEVHVWCVRWYDTRQELELLKSESNPI